MRNITPEEAIHKGKYMVIISLITAFIVLAVHKFRTMGCHFGSCLITIIFWFVITALVLIGGMLYFVGLSQQKTGRRC